MSYKSNELIKCPHCGFVHRGTMWSVITASENSGMKNKIISGSMFVRKCKSCGENFTLYHPVLYDDDFNNALIYYSPTDLGTLDAIDAIKDRRNEVGPNDKYKIRIVTSANCLREKARIFEMDMDDRIVEIVKIVMLEQIAKKGYAGKIKEVLCWVNNNKSLELAFFGQKNGTVTVDYPFYQYVETKCKLLLNSKCNDINNVDLDWAIEFLDKHNFILS